MTKEKQMISRYVYPFLIENPRKMKKNLSKDSLTWEKIEREPRLLSSPVREQFNKENGNIEIYKITDYGYKECVSDNRETELVLKVKKDQDDYYRSVFMISDVSLWVFSSGLSFIVLDISFPAEYEVSDLSNFSSGFSRLKIGSLQETRSVEFKKEKHTFDFCGFFEKMTSNLCLRSLEDSFDDIKPSYHTIYYENCENSFDSCSLSLDALCNNISSSGYSSGKNKKISHIEINQFDGVRWLGSVSSVVLYCWKQEDREFNLSEVTYKHAQNDYFSLFMLAIHAKTFVLFCNAEIIRLRKKTYELSKIKDKLIGFNGFFLLEYVSEHENVQFFYDELIRQLSVKRLSADIKDSISAIEKREDDIKERWLSPLKTFLFFFGFVGTINGVFSLLENFGEWEEYTFIDHVIVILVPVVILAFLAGGFLFRKKR